MKITVADGVAVNGPDLAVSLGDTGDAFVSITLQIGPRQPIEYSQHFEGVSAVIVKDIEEGDYDCFVVVGAYSYDDQGRRYDATVTVNGQRLAWAKGAIAPGESNDLGTARFKLGVGSGCAAAPGEGATS